jgi:MOSC domain-containing protein YiiM
LNLENASGVVVSVGYDATHAFSKPPKSHIDLIAGMGIQGDAHFGRTVQHRSRVAIDPTQPNLRQVHLLHSELFAMLKTAGFVVTAGDLGENVTTEGIDLLSLPAGTLLTLGKHASVEVTGLRNPCSQIEDFQTGLLGKLRFRGPDGALIRIAGIMATVKSSGRVMPCDRISVTLPPQPHRALDRV